MSEVPLYKMSEVPLCANPEGPAAVYLSEPQHVRGPCVEKLVLCMTTDVCVCLCVCVYVCERERVCV